MTRNFHSNPVLGISMMLTAILAGCQTLTPDPLSPPPGNPGTNSTPTPSTTPPSTTTTPPQTTPPANNTTPAPMPPIADAGPGQSVEDGVLVSLPGTGADPSGFPLTYQWSQIGGEPVTLNDSTKATASFTSPTRSDTLDFRLTVESAAGRAMDDVRVDVHAQPLVFVTDYVDNSIVSFRCPSKPGTAVQPLTVIKGANTQLKQPSDIVIDGSGGILFSNTGTERIGGFFDALKTTGNVSPQRFIGNPDAKLADPEALAYDPDTDLLFAGNFNDNPGSVTVYAAASQLGIFNTGAPTRRFFSYDCMNPRGMHLTPGGDLYVACAGSNSVSVFAGAAALNGQVNASRKIVSPAFENQVLLDVFVDGADRLYVVNSSNQHILVFNNAATQNGTPAPDADATIDGALGLHGIAVDDNGTACISDNAGGALLIIRNMASKNGKTTPDIIIPNGTIPLKGPRHIVFLER